MKVLKKGRKQKGWAAEQECSGAGNGGGGCGALLLVELADLFHTGSSSYDGSSESNVTFECMECGVLTDLCKEVTHNIPYRIMQEIKSCTVPPSRRRALVESPF
ncbi:MAG: hypothetical protein WC761_02295 [Candidatus Paceibacterota bacterium]|jgi:hypothetical protein